MFREGIGKHMSGGVISQEVAKYISKINFKNYVPNEKKIKQ
jgi:hypothetical protein